MDGERKINLSEGVPLNTGAANIFLNTGNNTKSPKGTVIQLKTDNNSPADVGLHINTTFSIASSKKIRLLFVLNFLLCMICIVISCSVAFYYWSEMSSMRRQLDAIKDQILIQSLRDSSSGQERAQAGALVSFRRKMKGDEGDERWEAADREPRRQTKDDHPLNARRYADDTAPGQKLDVPVLPQKEILVAHFIGDMKEGNLGEKGRIGPWTRDAALSTERGAARIELHRDYVTINESGLYFLYAQVVYLSQAPNCYFVWARADSPEQSSPKPRLLTSCSTGDDSSARPLEKSQLSCSTQTVARLHKGDVITVTQREHNRTVWLRPGYSHFGFIKLSS